MFNWDGNGKGGQGRTPPIFLTDATWALVVSNMVLATTICGARYKTLNRNGKRNQKPWLNHNIAEIQPPSNQPRTRESMPNWMDKSSLGTRACETTIRSSGETEIGIFPMCNCIFRGYRHGARLYWQPKARAKEVYQCCMRHLLDSYLECINTLHSTLQKSLQHSLNMLPQG